MAKKIITIILVLFAIVAIAYVVYMWYLQNQFSAVQEIEAPTQVQVTPSGQNTNVITNSAQQVVVTAPLKKDTDGDGLDDEQEAQLRTNINQKDSDLDGLSDFEEVNIYGTDPNHVDTDGDGFDDGVELRSGYNPKGDGQLLDLQRVLNQ